MRRGFKMSVRPGQTGRHIWCRHRMCPTSLRGREGSPSFVGWCRSVFMRCDGCPSRSIKRSRSSIHHPRRGGFRNSREQRSSGDDEVRSSFQGLYLRQPEPSLSDRIFISSCWYGYRREWDSSWCIDHQVELGTFLYRCGCASRWLSWWGSGGLGNRLVGHIVGDSTFGCLVINATMSK